ncbi:MAG TPA: hypothetical protein GX518_02510 [Firmicutes bacterium]|nr:hypothetical protein [Bacillota bacterium]
MKRGRKMVLLVNKMNALLSFDTKEGGVYLLPFEKREVSEKVLKSEQVQAAVRAGYVKILKREAKKES